MVSVGSIFPCPRKRKNELEKGQDKPKTLPVKKKKKKELELTVKVPTPTMCIGVTLVIIPKVLWESNPWHELPSPLSWCEAFRGKREEEEETIKSQGKAAAGERHQQVNPWIGTEMGSAGLGFSIWVVPELRMGMPHPALLSLWCFDYQKEFLIGKNKGYGVVGKGEMALS